MNRRALVGPFVDGELLLGVALWLVQGVWFAVYADLLRGDPTGVRAPHDDGSAPASAGDARQRCLVRRLAGALAASRAGAARAVEQRRHLVRATNSGVSAIVDPAGRIVTRTSLLTRENLRGTVHPLAGGRRPPR